MKSLKQSCLCTSCLPPEQARDRGVSLVLSDWASMSPPLSSRISTTPTWPAVAARIKGVNPMGRHTRTLNISASSLYKYTSVKIMKEPLTLLVPVLNVGPTRNEHWDKLFMATCAGQGQRCVVIALRLTRTNIKQRCLKTNMYLTQFYHVYKCCQEVFCAIWLLFMCREDGLTCASMSTEG